MTHRRALAVALAATFGWAPALLAQGPPSGRCDLVIDETPTTRINLQKVGGTDQYNSFIGGTVNARCAGQDVRLRADSAEAYGQSNVLYLIGNVRYTEPRARVDATRMTYFRSDERLLMEGNVVAVLPTGTTMRGPQADYYRAVAGLRPRTRLVAPGRPTVTLVEKDTAGKRGEPTRITANLITMDGDSLVYASGNVDIQRTDLEAKGDSAFMDSGREFARLMRQPRITGKQRRPFTLVGGVIDLYSRRRQLERVLAQSQAVATSEDLRLASDTIDMRMSADSAENTIERVYVWGASRARATSPERDIVADSLDVRMPRQRLLEVHAVRGAFAQTAPDSTKVRSGEKDWMRGDTIFARFDTSQAPRPVAAPGAPATPPGSARAGNRRNADRNAARDTSARVAAARPAGSDTTSRPRLRELEASGNASSWYQIPSQEGPSAPPSINYVRGREILLTFLNNEVNRVTVQDQGAGMFLEPATDSTASGTARPGAAPRPGAPTPAAPGGTPTPRPPASRPVARPASRP